MGRSLNQSKVWVLADETDYGIVVTDVSTGNEVVVQVQKDDLAKFETKSRFGRPIERLKVRGRRVGAEGGLIMVRFDGVKEPVYVREEAPPGEGDEAKEAAESVA